jgi:hypothetical protein
MKSEIHSRKSFLKKLGMVVGAGAVAPFATASGVTFRNDEMLDDEQKEFLLVYESWLEEFHGIVKLQKSGLETATTRKQMIELTARAQEWRHQLEVHMLNHNFAQHYNQITLSITNDIA